MQLWRLVCKIRQFFFVPDQCENGECQHASVLLDRRQDCFDNSDRQPPNRHHVNSSHHNLFNPPSKVTLDGVGHYVMEKLDNPAQCPSTHFLCPDDLCLPVYLICNGVTDCQGGMDELDCDSYICPGYYRCWRSKVLYFPCNYFLMVCYYVIFYLCIILNMLMLS